VLTGFAANGPRRVSPNEKLNLAAVGVGGKGNADIACCGSENIVALCDVDETALAKQRERRPKANIYRDWRVMLEKEKSLDGIIISTPDHTHAAIAAAAMRLGKHVYCQKPLTQTVYEARLLQRLARESGVATQMGNQGCADDGLRRAIEVVQSGLLGAVREVHVWSNRPIWPQGMDRPAGEDPVPAHLDWDLWLGPAPWRPYKHEWPGDPNNKGRYGRFYYHSFNWRGWQDFGTGAMGDMGCHTANMAFHALKLGHPTEVEAESPPMNQESWPLKSKIRFAFPAREGLAPVTLWWYDGGNPRRDNPHAHDGDNKPTRDVVADIEEMMGDVPGSGYVLLGDKGKIFSPDYYAGRFFVRLKDEKELVNGNEHEAVRAVPVTLPRSGIKGTADSRHHQEWIAACKGGPPGFSNFNNAALLTEIFLLGGVALQVGRKLEWHGANMCAKNTPEAARFLQRDYRKGWTL
jgi:predicted dehydrogenase